MSKEPGSSVAKENNAIDAPSSEGVSVIIPAYNVASYLAKGVYSVLQGNYDNVEIIVVDDASTDATPDVIRALELADGRVRSLRLPRNGGPSVARNAGIAQARLEWIALLDSDDWWAPGRLQSLLGLAAITHADIVSDDLYLVAEGAEMPWTTMYKLHGWRQAETHVLLAHEFCERDWTLQPIFRTQWLRHQGLLFQETQRSGEEDFVFCLEALLRGARWVTGDKAFYFYLSRPGALTRSHKIAEGLIASAEKMAVDPRIRENPVLYRAFMERLNRIKLAHWRNLLAHRVRSGHWLSATAMVGRAPYRIPGLFRALQRSRKLHAMIDRSLIVQKRS